MYNKGLKGWLKHLDFIVLDLAVLELSFILAYRLRHPGLSIFDNEEYRSVFFVLALAMLMAELLLRVHSDILRRGYMKELLSVIKQILFIAAVILAYLFFSKISVQYSRLVVLYFIIISTVLVFVSRIVWKKTIIRLGKNTGSVRQMFLLTTSDIAAEVIDTIRKNSFGMINITGMALADRENSAAVGRVINGVTEETDMDSVTEYISRRWVDEVMIFLPPEYETPSDLLRDCYLMGITTHVALNFDPDRYYSYEAGEVAGIYTLTESVRIADGYDVVIKRLMDIAGSVIGLAITALLTIVVAPAIMISDPGPVFFAQERVGRNGRIFRMYKFRSMYKDADSRKDSLRGENEMSGNMFKIDCDPRIIGSGPDGKKHGVGWFLRRTSIDEFPQFLNVLCGDMSLVGTRPPTVDEWKKYETRHRARLAMKPGITGLWQAYGRSDIKDFDKVVDMDMEYINTWSIAGDIKIICRTVVSVITGQGAE